MSWPLHRVPPDAASQPTFIGLDCEMVGSTGSSRELVKLAVVDSAGQLLYQVSSTNRLRHHVHAQSVSNADGLAARCQHSLWLLVGCARHVRHHKPAAVSQQISSVLRLYRS